MTPPEQRPSAPNQFCAGKVHADLGRPALVDPLAKAGPSRVGLVEDGAMFCTSCASELSRGGGEGR
jgi:hypothetical protein